MIESAETMKSQYAKISKKRWPDMTPAEQEAQLKQFDKPIDPRDVKPLSKNQRLLWDRMRASKPDVSITVHDGRTDVLIHLDDDLVLRAAAYAKKNRTTLPKMIDRGLRGLLASAG
jgi:hypothetical protein